jgi:hypothetical protein
VLSDMPTAVAEQVCRGSHDASTLSFRRTPPFSGADRMAFASSLRRVSRRERFSRCWAAMRRATPELIVALPRSRTASRTQDRSCRVPSPPWICGGTAPPFISANPNALDSLNAMSLGSFASMKSPSPKTRRLSASSLPAFEPVGRDEDEGAGQDVSSVGRARIICPEAPTPSRQEVVSLNDGRARRPFACENLRI